MPDDRCGRGRVHDAVSYVGAHVLRWAWLRSELSGHVGGGTIALPAACWARACRCARTSLSLRVTRFGDGGRCRTPGLWAAARPYPRHRWQGPCVCVGGNTYGCSAGGARSYLLGGADTCVNGVELVRVAGPFAAYARAFCGYDVVGVTVAVRRLSDGKFVGFVQQRQRLVLRMSSPWGRSC